jgi:tetratricopeptide (TPR) repeat protein
MESPVDNAGKASWEEKKAAATEFFKNGKFEEAIRGYQEALHLLESAKRIATVPRPMQSRKGEKADNTSSECNFIEEKVKLITNVALCYLKVSQPSDAISQCNDCLILQPGNEKALLRRGRAYNEMFISERAEKDFRECYKKHKSRDALVELQQFKQDCKNISRKFCDVLIKKHCCTVAVYLPPTEKTNSMLNLGGNSTLVK